MWIIATSPNAPQSVTTNSAGGIAHSPGNRGLHGIFVSSTGQAWDLFPMKQPEKVAETSSPVRIIHPTRKDRAENSQGGARALWALSADREVVEL